MDDPKPTPPPPGPSPNPEGDDTRVSFCFELFVGIGFHCQFR